MKGKLGCTPGRWEREVTKAAEAAGVDPVKVLAGSMHRVHASVRWSVWRDLVGRGFSYYSIGNAGGFDHTSVRYACLQDRGPRHGRPLKDPDPDGIRSIGEVIEQHFAEIVGVDA